MKNKTTAMKSITIDVPASHVWTALTRSELIKQYFFGTNASSAWKAGSPITFSGEWEGKEYEDKGTILNIEPGKLLRYSYWSALSGLEDKPENYVTITYKLSGEKNKTTVNVSQDNIPDEKMKEHAEQNWEKVLNNLKELLEKEIVLAV